MINLLKSYKFEFGYTKKSLGQHFLINKEMLNLIVEECMHYINDPKLSNIIEVGAGCGLLTQFLLERGLNVTAIEIDNKLCDFLQRYLFYYPNLKILNQDFLDFNLDKDEAIIVGNLPYNTAARMFLYSINFVSNIRCMILMFQKEVAERIISMPNSKKYSYISVITRYYFDVEKIANISGKNFWPSTEVNSTILKFFPKNRIFNDMEKERDFFNFLKIAFKMKRKTLKNNLRSYTNSELVIDKFFKKDVRAEELDLEDFIKLYNSLV
ncbi:MAG: 16S rRNA (adenine(1518)-N(6)/adenine(1519)-N(6))-dimethyltransferase RsmA [Deferribacterota bacterium]|nr:16S rRNA (adenine(1518)-N(6)/adenine(1519)-N(6))-dimethyltransferase RsmA [Deferribacterota bacterium]